MIALVVFAVFGLYLLVSALAVYGTFRKARKSGFNPWFPAITVALGMYLLVFWDYIPVLIKHHDLCTEQGGFWIYKTPEQWFKENPDAIGKNWGDKRNAIRYETINGKIRTWHSEYVYSESSYDRHYAHAIRREESRLIDVRTGEVLARVIDFERGVGNPMLHADSITDYKFWLGMGKNDCRKNGESCQRKFSNLITKYKLIGGKRNGK